MARHFVDPSSAVLVSPTSRCLAAAEGTAYSTNCPMLYSLKAITDLDVLVGLPTYPKKKGAFCPSLLAELMLNASFHCLCYPL